jgi:tetratricopeptide (TPR) repeat protein
VVRITSRSSSSFRSFTNIFLVDASTVETIETGLKAIVTARNAGSTAEAALEWLQGTQDEWLLLFDNADDPKIDLNKWFPQCTHGNILITSRNPGLQVYTGSHSLVSDMEESDAVELLLRSAAQESSVNNKRLATDIVKVCVILEHPSSRLKCFYKALWYLPLAIIQAGAFIAKSGALDSYLSLYTKNWARLLREKPAQTHDDYSWTVYTTWQISFERLTVPAAMLLQLCSLLHHQGISEDIFSTASSYKFPTAGPPREELQKPLEFLAHFLDPTGVWDSLRFMDVLNEFRAYSLVNFNPQRNSFSIHPLVHSWTRTTLADEQSYHYILVAIVGMSFDATPDEDVQLASLKLLLHVDSLVHRAAPVIPDFRFQYGAIYWWVDRLDDAEWLQVAVLQDRKSRLGEEHADTLAAMINLAATYRSLEKLKEAEELQTVVLTTRQKTLGEDDPETLSAMGNLAATYRNLGKLKEAAELEVVVLAKQSRILGEDHTATLHTMADLAWTYHQLPNLKEAVRLGVGVFEKRRRVLGEDHPDTLVAMTNLAATYGKLGKLNEAEVLQVAVLEKRKRILGEDHPETLVSMAFLGSTYHKMGKFKEAEVLEVIVVEKRRRILGEEHPQTVQAMATLAWTYHHLGQANAAEQLQTKILQQRIIMLGANHQETLAAAKELVEIQQGIRTSKGTTLKKVSTVGKFFRRKQA